MTLEKFEYDNKIVRNFAIATMVWGIVAMLVGLLAALQLPFPAFNFDSHATFGRVRPLHTNAVVFAFVGNAMFMGIYYSLQRLLKARMY
ncbi:MAG TPA: cbb3-type cytochrome c oxidase subunit I, partial [Bacteroidia bacterium]|nr:cbb3-type cytochrome c oxidase subunit I [Bacteroidia bacterium]